MLDDCGYEVIDWNYTHGAEALPNPALRIGWMNMPRRMMRRINEDVAVRLMGGASLMVITR